MIKNKDKIWSAAVASREVCEWCGARGCDPAHIIPRKFLKTRHLLENGLFLCRECHIKFDRNVEFRDKVINILVGREKYRRLLEISQGIVSPENSKLKELKK